MCEFDYNIENSFIYADKVDLQSLIRKLIWWLDKIGFQCTTHKIQKEVHTCDHFREHWTTEHCPDYFSKFKMEEAHHVNPVFAK